MRTLNRKTAPKKPNTSPSLASNAVRNKMFKPNPPADIEELNLPAVNEPVKLPKVDPTFSCDLTSLGTRALAQQHQYAVGMYSYVIACLANIETQHAAIKNARSRATAELRVLYHSGQNKYMLDCRVDTDPGIVDLDTKLEITEAKRTLLKAQAEIYNSRCNLLSRELTRRKVELEQRV